MSDTETWTEYFEIVIGVPVGVLYVLCPLLLYSYYTARGKLDSIWGGEEDDCHFLKLVVGFPCACCCVYEDVHCVEGFFWCLLCCLGKRDGFVKEGGTSPCHEACCFSCLLCDAVAYPVCAIIHCPCLPCISDYLNFRMRKVFRRAIPNVLDTTVTLESLQQAKQKSRDRSRRMCQATCGDCGECVDRCTACVLCPINCCTKCTGEICPPLTEEEMKESGLDKKGGKTAVAPADMNTIKVTPVHEVPYPEPKPP